jgi:FkbM family methyltransferase
MLGVAKRAAKRVLGRFGLQVSRTTSAARDPFDLQRELVSIMDPVIFDVGAHIGAVTQRYRQLFPRAWIHCFEPFPTSFSMLLQAAENDPRIRCHQLALSSTRGVEALHANASPATNSLLATDTRGQFYWGQGLLDTRKQLQVTTNTVDSFCLEMGVEQVDILKLDVQGAEFSVLQGATRMLRRGLISLIYTEIIIAPTYAGQHKLHEYLSLFDSFGYEVLDFFNAVRSRKQLIQTEMLLVSPLLKKQNALRSMSG